MMPTADVMAKLGVRFLKFPYTWAIGHLASELDGYIKEEKLGLHPPYTGILLVPEGRVANACLLDYWKQYVHVIDSPELMKAMLPLAVQPELQYDITHLMARDYDTARIYAVNTLWGDRPPLLSLRQDHAERGSRCLEELGVPRDAWFVCVHARQTAYLANNAHAHRSVDIQNYRLAMETIEALGGWCIRMGDTAMAPLPPMPHVIDYAHSDVKSDWMDIFLFASCHFMLGSNSGGLSVARAFGVPCLLPNQIPLSVLALGPQDLSIPKLLWKRAEGRYLTFGEILGSRLGMGNCYAQEFEQAGVDIIESSPEDIRDLVLEMIDRLEGRLSYSVEDEARQRRYKGLFRPGHYSHGGACRMGRSFLAKHEDLLPQMIGGIPATSTVCIAQVRVGSELGLPSAEPAPEAKQALSDALLEWLGEDLRLLDLGCGDGQFVQTLLERNTFAAGLELPSDGPVGEAWTALPGHLLEGDPAAPFLLMERTASGSECPITFQVITGMNLLGRLGPEALPGLLRNIDSHLAPGGVVCMSMTDDQQEAGLTAWEAGGFQAHAWADSYFRTGGPLRAFTRMGSDLPNRAWLEARVRWLEVEPSIANLDTTQALEATRRVLAAAPRADLVLAQCERLVGLEDLEDGLEELVQLSMSFPDLPEVHLYLGAVRFNLGQTDAAEQSIRRSLALRWGNPTAHHVLGRIQHSEGRMAECIASFREALVYEPYELEILLDLSGALVQVCSIGDARPYLELALAIDPENTEARAMLDSIRPHLR